MKSQTDPRHNARKLALSSVFCWMFNEPDVEACINLSKELLETNQQAMNDAPEDGGETDFQLARFIIDGIKQHRTEIDRIITESAPEWPIDKISKIDLVILRIAVFEVVFGNKAPSKVAIDEAVELAKEFGNETSHKFVNGVLGTVVDKYLKEPKEENKDE